MQPTTKCILAIGVSAFVIAACDPGSSTLSTAPPTSLALSTSPTNPEGYPDDDWVFLPASLDADFTKFECTFAFTTGVTRNADSACQQKQWGKSQIYRMQARNMHTASTPPSAGCGGGPADFDAIRICSYAWPESTTPWGNYGPNGCVPLKPTFRCTA
jgi:hypothetical protein